MTFSASSCRILFFPNANDKSVFGLRLKAAAVINLKKFVKALKSGALLVMGVYAVWWAQRSYGFWL